MNDTNSSGAAVLTVYVVQVRVEGSPWADVGAAWNGTPDGKDRALCDAAVRRREVGVFARVVCRSESVVAQ